MATNESENQQNTNQQNTDGDMNLEEKIEIRRKKVYFLHLRGYVNVEIARTLKVSLSTVEKDLYQIRKDYRSWLNEFNMDGIGHTYRESHEQLDVIKEELWQKYYLERDEKIKIKILESITDKIMKANYLLKDRHEILHGRYHVG